MPVALRRRPADAIPRQIMNVLSNDENDSTAANENNRRHSSTTPEWTKEHVDLLLQDLQDSLNDRLAILASDTLKAKDAQKQIWFQSVVKIRKCVKNMTVKEFNDTYDCDLLSLLSIAPAGTGGIGAAATKKRDRPNHFKTPAPSKAPKSINTVSRTVKRGEAVFSENGSPIEPVAQGDLVATVTKKRRTEQAVNFDINVGDGQYINLTNPGNIQALDKSIKSTAIVQLQVLQDQMASLMAQLKEPNDV